MTNVVGTPNVTRFAEEIEDHIPKIWPGLPKFRRLSEAEDYNDFLSDTILSYASDCNWDCGPGYVSLVIGIRDDGRFRAEVWKITCGADYVGTEEVLACKDALTFEEMRKFACDASFSLTWHLNWENSKEELVSKFNMFPSPGKVFPYVGLALRDSALREGILNEEQQVRFGGQINPQFGWVLILAGGPGSGKSYKVSLEFLPDLG